MKPILLILIMLMSALAPVQAGPSGGRVPKKETASAQLKHAGQVKKAAKGLKGEELTAQLQRALKAYAAVQKYFPEEASAGARALYSRGEIHRRLKDLPMALESYAAIADRFPEQITRIEMADLWIGKIHEKLENHGKARAAWRRVAKKGADPVRRIQAFDRIALSYLLEGKEKKAAEQIDSCHELFGAAAREPGKKAARIRKALEKMRSGAKLEELKSFGSKE